jgi:hypothetical protein
MEPGTSRRAVRWAVSGRVTGSGKFNQLVSKEDEYLTFAASTLDLARRTADQRGKSRLLAMADAWLDLSERAAKRPKHRAHSRREHPLVRRILGSDKTEAE